MANLTPTTASSYTHADWKGAMADAAECLVGVGRDLEEMSAALAEVKAGQTHRDAVDFVRTHVYEELRAALTLVQRTDDRYIPLFEAVEHAGGQREVAQDKRYHQHD